MSLTAASATILQTDTSNFLPPPVGINTYQNTWNDSVRDDIYGVGHPLDWWEARNNRQHSENNSSGVA